MITKYTTNQYGRHYLKPEEFLAPFDAMINDFFNHTGMSKTIPSEFFIKGKYPKCNVLEFDDSISIEAGIPGMDKNDIKIELVDDTLSISSSKKTNDPKGTYIKKELKNSSWRRSFFLNDSLDTSTIEAKVKNGLLTIVIKKIAPNKTLPKVKSIEIS